MDEGASDDEFATAERVTLDTERHHEDRVFTSPSSYWTSTSTHQVAQLPTPQQIHQTAASNEEDDKAQAPLPSAADLVLHVQDLDLFAPSPPDDKDSKAASPQVTRSPAPAASRRARTSAARSFSSMSTIRRSKERQSSRTKHSGQQEDLWRARFRELRHYKQVHGDCLVPHNYNGNLPLARWVKRQRYQFRRLKEGQSSTMTPERRQSLEDLGFVWDFHGDVWEERIAELKAFKTRHSHCNVPCPYPENQGLGIWVKCQRRQRKLLDEGKQSSMTQSRIQELDAIGFTWGLRSYKKRKASPPPSYG